MKIFFAFIITIFLVLGGYHLTFRRLKMPLFARGFYLTGIEFLFLGLLLGPHFLNIINNETVEELAPLTILLLGWIGLLFGFQFEIPKLKRISGKFFTAAAVESVLTFGMVFTGTMYILPVIGTIPDGIITTAALIMGAAAASTAQTGLALRKPDSFPEHRKTLKLLRYISSIDGLTGILILGFAFLSRDSISNYSLTISERIAGFLIPIFACTGFMILYLLFLIRRKQESELSLVVIGMAIFTSGAAMILNFSPLFANFLLGVCIVNLTRDKERIFNLLVSVEKPVYLLLLIFLGCMLQPPEPWMLLAAALFFLFRTMGKMSGGYIVTCLQKKETHLKPYLGYGLLEQGGLPFAILYDFYQGFPGKTAGQIISIVIISIIFNDFISPIMLNRLLKGRES